MDRIIDINFDFRQDSICGDPDTDSQKLYKAHKLLWSKILPCGKTFDLNIVKDSYGRLLIKNNLCGNLSSDRMCPHFELKYKVRTIGGHIVFPAHKKDGFTINQARGVNRKICDRFDLTLECLRLFYQKKESPLYDTLVRYKDFFELFVNFSGYVDFFMLQVFLEENGHIKFSLPFDNFNRSPLPQTIDEYKTYKNHTIDLINCRNERILKSL